jgi:hypothetical protein
MSNYANIIRTHRLLSELRQGLWHCTSPSEFRQIIRDHFIKPNDGTGHKWGPRPYACQELGAVSLFDFQTPTQEKVLETSNRWGPFVCRHPTTVAVGLNRDLIASKLVPYPDNKINTTGAVIPYVETCHCGPIPITAITKCLLICSVDCARFYVEPVLADPRLAEVEREFQSIMAAAEAERAKGIEQVNAREKSPELRRLFREARDAAMRMQKTHGQMNRPGSDKESVGE